MPDHEWFGRYPPSQYLYVAKANPVVDRLTEIINKNRQELAAIRNTPFRKSIEAEKIIAADMQALGFLHSVTNRQYAPLFKKGLNFEVDFYHPGWQIAVEVEKGEINNVWKNICKFAESSVIRHGVLLVPVVRQGQQASSEFYQNTVKRLCHIERIYTLMESLLIIGY
ncbi:hypothetical protein TcarDRAFT_0475 [Thermosinus carboxydivorans Nor1]|uniref:Uncharacterized protein n=1 Tax=Thermosinus carboxydivorans Nor1 TaxID=401526 RepID=A1HTF9_9FIRM|nr:hypothetical protein [Thermosinus carboxydivorans]EAX46708.1 hypothetical protein TcarDRAFT_0475 [Thermosinus carboxydivorans Nor1]